MCSPALGRRSAWLLLDWLRSRSRPRESPCGQRPGRHPTVNPQLDAVKAPTGVFGTGTIWHVGSKQEYKTFSSISRKLQDGDVVEIDSGTYGCTEQSIVWTANNITVIGVDGRATFNATGCVITGDKGIFNPRGTNMIIDNIAFIGVQGPSRNDAGIRLDKRTRESVTVSGDALLNLSLQCCSPPRAPTPASSGHRAASRGRRHGIRA